VNLAVIAYAEALHDRLAAFDAAVAQMQARTTAPG